jgi:amidohydrolase
LNYFGFIMKNQLQREINAIYPKAVRIRRILHQYPELSGTEFNTAKRVFDYLKLLRLSPHFCVEKTGVWCAIKNGPGKTIALRADLDALPIKEENPVPYRSKVIGLMHACGHDMHTAILLGATEVLLRLKDHWSGTVVLLFQPNEEGEPGGALRMIKEKVFPKNAIAVLGLHVNADHTTGQIGIKSGADFAGITVFDITIHGKGGHGAFPEKAHNPIVCAAEIIHQLNILSKRSFHGHPVVLTLGTAQSGTRYNIIPDIAQLTGTIRTLSLAARKSITEHLNQVCHKTARSFKCSAEIKLSHSYPPGFNNEALSSQGKEILYRILGSRKIIIRPKPVMFSEDFAYYQQLVPGLFIHLGVRNPSLKTVPGIHTARFLPDESAIKTGMIYHTSMALALLKKPL